MSSKIDREIYITIDLNDDLIRIPRVTINELGCPEFIQLLIHPEKRTLAIRTCSQGGAHTHRIKSALLNSEESYELHSRFLMKSLNQICGNLTEGKSFRIKGRMYEHKTLAVFLLEEAVPIGREDNKQ